MTDTSASRRKEPDINQQAPLFINCVQQGWRTSGMRAIDGMRHNIFGMPVIKMEKWHVDSKRFAIPEYSNRAKVSQVTLADPFRKTA
ncbi:hypothetical protein TNCV_4782441 [Trichonephila clavipes]|nr:hypothetical protein TNCV_4782441 [Trichonephila clavipes]